MVKAGCVGCVCVRVLGVLGRYRLATHPPRDFCVTGKGWRACSARETGGGGVNQSVRNGWRLAVGRDVPKSMPVPFPLLDGKNCG
jgi:hypothetical protein